MKTVVKNKSGELKRPTAITKPASIKSIADAIANVVPSGNTGADYKTIQKSESEVVFDDKAFSGRTDGNSALMREVINIFLSETPERIRAIEQAIKKQQQEAAYRLAHTIKGSSANVGGNKLHAVAARIEKACNSADWREAENLMLKLSRQFEILERAMREFLKLVS